MASSVIIEKRKDLERPTPMMDQYLAIKSEYEEYILFYRLGDFYECFFEDAVVASKVLDLVLTGRDCGEGKKAAMCGVPFHKADSFIGKLVENGYKVGICEQVEDPKTAVGLVKREVIRVVTPGTVTDTAMLSEGQNNFLASIYYGTGGVGLCFTDISTGDVFTTYLEGKDNIDSRLKNEVASYNPAEAIINVTEAECGEIAAFFKDKTGTLVNYGMRRLFQYDRSRDSIRRVFGDEIDRLTAPEHIMSVGALLMYINETQKSEITFAKEINVYSKGQYMELDYNTRRNLELTESMRNKEKKGSLLWVLDKTKTAMGARLLRSWLLKPLLNPVQIAKRQSAVSDFKNNRMMRDELTELLSSTLDIERLTARAVYGTANAKDLRSIFVSIEKLPEIKTLLLQKSNNLKELAAQIDTLEDIAELLGKAIVDNPPYTIREGGMIRDGFSEDVDYYRSVKNNGKSIMESIEQREREATGIKTLRVDFNKVFGYYIEVTKSLIGQVPDRYVRKQTLTNCERYITEELKEMENTIFGADEKIVTFEYELFCGLKNVIAENSERIRKTANLIAEIDVYRSFAEVADRNGYICPEVDLSHDLVIKDGRHPVVEKFVTDNYFVPNDTSLDVTDNKVMIITGPNMAGKSTYMRQVAIITVMAQIGSFVPAKDARIGIVDKVFTRVGASDDLASGQSTFMLEMNEVATILKNATKRSLIIYDEVGRGTSTFDGMAIARSVVEYTYSKKIGAKTLFATHYHELTDMEDQFPGIVNYNIAAKKRGDSVIFLRKIVRGGTDDSYGIEVAKLAGVPSEVVKRAREILKDIESGVHIGTPSASVNKEDTNDLFAGFISSVNDDVADKLRSVDINTMTPIEAMNLLFELKIMLKE